ncbi:MAG: DUF4783 domain-containing protein [Flavobacteriales bacterium]|nr:DUF4783 domain-containing protein [Flavobacteriales bacterium]
MKFLISILLVFAAATGFAQNDITGEVAAALKKGDAASIAAHMMPQIELTLNDQDNNLGKAEAQKALATFFKDHPVTGFNIKHQGTSKLDDQYRIGDLTTQKGNFRVTFFMKKSGNSMQIRQLKIEPAE